jgi:hypothetical protein
MLESPDMITAQSDKLFNEWRQELKNRNEELAKTRALGVERDAEPDSVVKKLNPAIRALEI